MCVPLAVACPWLLESQSGAGCRCPEARVGEMEQRGHLGWGPMTGVPGEDAQELGTAPWGPWLCQGHRDLGLSFENLGKLLIRKRIRSNPKKQKGEWWVSGAAGGAVQGWGAAV